MGSLKYKIQLDKNSKIPGLLIHTAEPLSDGEFEEFQLTAQELLPKTSGLSFDPNEPFIIFERHSYCVNLIEHCTAIYSMLHKIQYGKIESIPNG